MLVINKTEILMININFAAESAVKSELQRTAKGCTGDDSEEAPEMRYEGPTTHHRWRIAPRGQTRGIHLGHRGWQGPVNQFRKGKLFCIIKTLNINMRK